MLKTSEKIRILVDRKNTSITEMADKIGTTRQNLSNKLKRNNFNENDLLKIADVLDQELILSFRDKENGDIL